MSLDPEVMDPVDDRPLAPAAYADQSGFLFLQLIIPAGRALKETG